MVELKYRANGNPQGKPRVFFSSHPTDFIYFEKLSKDILKKYDCAVYYCEYNDSLDIDDLVNQLEQMQLIIVPVTKKFLLEPNISFDIEFKFAVEKHIPILPILLEEGITEIYQEKCGNTQYLDVVSSDDTAISYQKKAEELFSAVILKEEDIAKIRNEFDAYIFLSYRKVDRVHSQKLMKLIHENDDLRDVAIWYDEFLHPGEDFSNEIDLALNKSDLFMLLVTPNLIEEDNYVMKIEYPQAKSINKPIVAVEAVKTKASELKKYFNDIPKRINYLDQKKLIESILYNIDKITLVKDESPEHTYLIGLAYLKGVDVEVNVEKGLNMIFDAAKKHCYDAIKEAIKIYENGIGVERNMEMVVNWKGVLMEYYALKQPEILENYSCDSKEYSKFFSKYFFDKLMYADNYGEYLDASKCDELLIGCEDLLEFLKDIPNDSYYHAALLFEDIRIKSLNRTYRYKESLKHFEKLHDITKHLDMNSLSVLFAYLSNKLEHAIILKLLERFDESITILNEIIEEYSPEDLFNIYNNCSFYHLYSRVYNELGTLCLLTNNDNYTELCKNSFSNCIKLSKKFAFNIRDAYGLNSLFNNYENIVQFAFLVNNYDNVKFLIEDCIKTISAIENEDTIKLSTNLKGKLYLKLAEVYKKEKHNDLFFENIGKSIDSLYFDFDELSVKQKIERFFMVADYYDQVSLFDEEINTLLKIFDYNLQDLPLIDIKVKYKLSDIYFKLEDYNKSFEYANEAYHQLKQLNTSNKNFYYEVMVNCLTTIFVSACYLNYDWINLFTTYKEIFDIFNNLPDNSPFFSNSFMIDMMYYYASTRLLDDTTFDEAEKLLFSCVKAYERLEKVCRGNYHNNITAIYVELIDYYVTKLDYDTAAQMMKLGFLATEDNDLLYDSRLALFRKCIIRYKEMNLFEEAIKMYEVANYEVNKTIKKLYNIELKDIATVKNNNYLYEYMLLINTFAEFLMEDNRYTPAANELKISLKFIKSIDTTGPYEFRIYNIGMVYYNIGKCLLMANSNSLAKTFFEFAIIEFNKCKEKDVNKINEILELIKTI